MRGSKDQKHNGRAGADAFTQELNAYRTLYGVKKVDQVLAVYAIGLEWLRLEGHGQMSLSAVEHAPGPHVAVEKLVQMPQITGLLDVLAKAPVPSPRVVSYAIHTHDGHARITMRELIEVATWLRG